MKEFIIEWCRIMVIGLGGLMYVVIFFLGCFLLDGDKPQNGLYIALWVLFYGVTTVASYVTYQKNKK
nr:MAG: hypothetical protein [Bacteriophage sp.]